MDDGVILCFHKSLFVKTSVCYAVINDSDSASPQESCSSGNLSVSGIPGSQSDAHTTGGSFSLVSLGNLQGFLSSSIQTVQVLTMFPWCTDSVLPVLQNRTEKRICLDFFLHNLPVNSRENFILENKVAYF